MAIDVETKDCTSVTDAELAEMADLCAEGPNPFSIGLLSKQTEEWVLVTTARDNGRLKGFLFSTLERIGGTPSVIIGLASVVRNSKRDTVLRGMLADQNRRALMAFPDEDVVFGTRCNDPAGFEAFKALSSINPRPDHKSSGEERAWGKRFAKRFQIPPSRYLDREFRVLGDGNQSCVFDHESSKPEKTDPEVAAYFDDFDIANGDCLVIIGWAMAEDLLKYS